MTDLRDHFGGGVSEAAARMEAERAVDEEQDSAAVGGGEILAMLERREAVQNRIADLQEESKVLSARIKASLFDGDTPQGSASIGPYKVSLRQPVKRCSVSDLVEAGVGYSVILGAVKTVGASAVRKTGASEEQVTASLVKSDAKPSIVVTESDMGKFMRKRKDA